MRELCAALDRSQAEKEALQDEISRIISTGEADVINRLVIEKDAEINRLRRRLDEREGFVSRIVIQPQPPIVSTDRRITDSGS